MQEKHCPVCYGALEVRELAPCDDCGANPKEIEHFKQGEHTFAIYETFSGMELTLCDFCCLDFGTYNPEFFGLPKKPRIGFDKMKLVRSLDSSSLQLGKVCTQCGLRLTFARLVAQARDQHARRE